MENEQDDTKLTDELMKHLENQNESLAESYKLMFNQLQKLQVEEEMLMRKLHEVMSAQGHTKKNKDNPEESGNSKAER